MTATTPSNKNKLAPTLPAPPAAPAPQPTWWDALVKALLRALGAPAS